MTKSAAAQANGLRGMDGILSHQWQRDDLAAALLLHEHDHKPFRRLVGKGFERVEHAPPGFILSRVEGLRNAFRAGPIPREHILIREHVGETGEIAKPLVLGHL